MDTIKRTISLEQFKTRIPENGKNGNGWGKLHNDYVVTSGDTIYPLKDTLPMLQSGKTNLYILRYKTMLRWYLYLRNFAAESSLYTVMDCGSGSKRWKFNDEENEVKFSYLEKGGAIVATELPEVSSVTENTVALINSDADTFNRIFRTPQRSYEWKFIAWYKDRFNHVGGVEEVPPFADVNLILTQDIDDEGILTAPVDIWIPKKKYYLGDKVYYEENGEGAIYVLVRGEEFEETDLTKDLYYSGYTGVGGIETGETPISYTKETVFYDERNGIYRLFTPFYRGYYDKDKKIVLFDESEGTHWKVSSASTITERATKINGITENYLAAVTPSFFSYDDDGEILPFRTITKETPATDDRDGIIEYVPYTTLNFTFSAIEDTVKDGFFNCLSSITFYNSSVSLSGKTYAEYLADEKSGLTSMYTVNEKCQVLMNRYRTNVAVEQQYDVKIAESSTTELFKLIEGEIVTIEDKNAFREWFRMCRIVSITNESGLTNILNSAVTPNEEYHFITTYCDSAKITYYIDNKSGSTIDYGVFHEDIVNCNYSEYPCKLKRYSGITKMVWVKCEVPNGSEPVTTPTLPESPNMNTIYRYTGKQAIEGVLNGEKYYIRSGDTMCYRNVFAYIYLNRETTNEPDGINVDYNGKKVIFSNIEYTKKVDDDYKNFQLIGNFKDERTLGLQDIDEKGIDVYVDRGRYAAFENHNILSEVSTFNDLLNYRNNFFKLTVNDDDG